MLFIILEGKHSSAHRVAGWPRRNSKNSRSTRCQS